MDSALSQAIRAAQQGTDFGRGGFQDSCQYRLQLQGNGIEYGMFLGAMHPAIAWLAIDVFQVYPFTADHSVMVVKGIDLKDARREPCVCMNLEQPVSVVGHHGDGVGQEGSGAVLRGQRRHAVTRPSLQRRQWLYICVRRPRQYVPLTGLVIDGLRCVAVGPAVCIFRCVVKPASPPSQPDTSMTCRWRMQLSSAVAQSSRRLTGTHTRAGRSTVCGLLRCITGDRSARIWCSDV